MSTRKEKKWKLLLLAEEVNKLSLVANDEYISAALLKHIETDNSENIMFTSINPSNTLHDLKHLKDSKLINNIKVLPFNWTLSPITANILVDPLNIYRFPILNILNAIEYLTISIFSKGYDETWDKDGKQSKEEIISQRYERVISSFFIVLILTIKEYKHHHIFIKDLISKIIHRFEVILGGDNNYTDKSCQFTLRAILSYIKSDQWPSNDTLSFVGSVYDALLGYDVMKLLKILIMEEYLTLINLAGGPGIALSKPQSTYDISNKNNDIYKNIKSIQLITLENFAVYNTHPFYNIWNFLTLLAGMKTSLENKVQSFSQYYVTGGLSRRVLTELLRLDMVVLLMCSICSYGLREKLKSVSYMYVKYTDTDMVNQKIWKVMTHITNVPVKSEWLYLLTRKWQDLNDPMGKKGAREVLNKKTEYMQRNMTDSIRRSNIIIHDLYAFLSFYLLYISSRGGGGENVTINPENEKKFTTSTVFIPQMSSMLGQQLYSKFNTPVLEMENGWLLSLVGIWALRNAVRVGNNMEAYPLINFLSSVTFSNKTSEELLQIILNNKFVNNITFKENLDYAFSLYVDWDKFSINNNKSNFINKQLSQLNMNNYHDDINKNTINGLYILSKEKVKNLSIDNLLSMEKLPLTEYEIYKD
uniref:Wsv327-like protein n=1 Tax=Trachysalambria curvirostris majanivirus TaxID=2984281 RepID=A0A9C7BWN6_9VIRU|nr:MAG: wsv327-like protein [Trachysalambria curvirostris majanivirus]